MRAPDQWEGVISMGDARTASLGYYHRAVWIKQMGAANPFNVDRLVEVVADAWQRRAARG